MRAWLLCFTCFLLFFSAPAQKKEQQFDYNFKPVKKNGRYQVITEKQGELWYRQAYYLPEKLIAMEAKYKDEDCKVPQGLVTWYHPTRYVQSIGNYNDGKKEGPWLEYNEDGSLKDSSTWANGHLKGIALRWHFNGGIADSSNFDGSGNGIRVSYYEDGKIFSEAYFEQDTLKTGRWKYFQKNGKPFAIVDYEKGKKTGCECYDEEGTKLDTSICNQEKEASFPGGITGWRKFLERTLNAQVPSDKGAKDGSYTVIVRFTIDKEGNLQGLKATTNYGFGMEEETLRVLRLSPKWEPAIMFGRKVNAYRLQPLTFIIASR